MDSKTLRSKAGKPGPVNVSNLIKLIPLDSKDSEDAHNKLRDKIAKNIAERYVQNSIYSRISAGTLVAVNPNRPHPFDGEISIYELASLCGTENEIPPHVYDIAASAYLHMTRSNENQMIIASGEVGSGKSEYLRLAHQHLNHLSFISGGGDNVYHPIRVTSTALLSVLDTFGSACTVFNNSSTRFSSCCELQFNDDGVMSGTRVTTFNFEASRVSGQCNGARGWEDERNFHIYYQLLAGASQEEKTELRLMEPKDYLYLNKGHAATVYSFHEAQNFELTRSAMKSIGMTKNKQAEIWQLLAAILHLGNISFAIDAQNNAAYVTNRSILTFTADLLEVDVEELESTLTARSVFAGEGGLLYFFLYAVTSELLDVASSESARNSLANLLYSLLFTWIVEYSSSKLADSDSNNYIGLVNIAGHDGRPNTINNFYQLSARYMAEKISQFNWITISESISSDDEALIGSIDRLIDPSMISMYENQSYGIFSIVDQFTKSYLAKESVIEWQIYEEIKRQQVDNKLVSSGPPGWSSFVVRHSSESASYSLETFVHSNRGNTWSVGVIGLFGLRKGISSKSTRFVNKLLSEIETDVKYHPRAVDSVISIQHGGFFPRKSDDTTKRSKRVITLSHNGSPRTPLAPITPIDLRKFESSSTALSQFHTAVEGLVHKLDGSRNWNIICLRPNSVVKSGDLNAQKLVAQIQNANLVALVKASASMKYTVTLSLREFLSNYSTAYGFDSELTGSDSELKAHIAMIFERREVLESSATIVDDDILLSETYWRSLESLKDKALPQARRRIHMSVAPTKKAMLLPGSTIDGGAVQKSSQLSNFNHMSQMELGSLAEVAIESNAPPPIKVKRNWLNKQKKEKKPRAPMSSQRYHWVNYTNCVTFCIPTWCLVNCGKITSPDVQMAWREKVALCSIIIFMSGLMIFFVAGLGLFIIVDAKIGRLLCPTQSLYAMSELQNHKNYLTSDVLAAWNGRVYQIGSFAAKHPVPALSTFLAGGHDISAYFPTIDPDSGFFPPSCYKVLNKRSAIASTWMTYSNAVNGKCYDASVVKPTLSSNSSAYCHDTQSIKDDIVYQNSALYNVYPAGDIAWSKFEVSSHNTAGDAWILFQSNFYNVSAIVSNPKRFSSIFSAAAIDAFTNFAGMDASIAAGAIGPYVNCLKDTYYTGTLDTRLGNAACAASEYILYSVTGVLVFLILIKFLAALQLGKKAMPELQEKFVLLQVPCYTEGEDSLRKTIDSLSLFEYNDTRKLLFLIADGMVRGAGNELATPEIIMKILGIDPTVNSPEAKSYIALGDGSKQHNKAKVYSGLYEIKSKAVPYILVIKTGNETETSRPGNRGKRDSQMILMKFLNKVHYQSPMTPLDTEIFHHCKDIIGVDPFLYEYCLMVDADTEAFPDSLNRLIACMVQDSKIMGICGETRIANPKDTWVTAVQVYEYYISHHLAKAFESLFGSVTCLPGCFCMYRIRTAEEKLPLLIHPDIIAQYEDNNVDTLHKKNLLSLGEDRYLTTLMLKHFPDFRNKFTPDAICLTIVPDKFSILLSQRRRWINSTIHNLFELLYLPQLCGCLCFSMRMVVFLDMFATLIMPAAVVYLIYLIVASIQSQVAPILSLVMMAAAYGLQIIIFVIKGEFQHIGWLIISILAMPIFSFALPLYAYWNFDDFSWGNTRRLAGAEKDVGHSGGNAEKFDISTIPLVAWGSTDDENDKKGKRKTFSTYEPSESGSKSTKDGATRLSQYSEPSSKKTASNYESSNAGQQLDYNARPSVMYNQAPYVPYGIPTTYIQQPTMQSHYVLPAPYRLSTAMSVSGDFERLNSHDNLLQMSGPNEKFDASSITEDELRYQIRAIMASSPLEDLTKKKVRERLEAFFGCKLTDRKEIINDQIEQFLKESRL